MAQDVCPRFLDYFGMGHFHHQIRVPFPKGSEAVELQGRGHAPCQASQVTVPDKNKLKAQFRSVSQKAGDEGLTWGRQRRGLENQRGLGTQREGDRGHRSERGTETPRER